MRSPTVILNDDQIRSFRENGYLALDAMTTAEEVAVLRQVLDRLLNTKAGYHEGAQFDLMSRGGDDTPPRLPQIMNPGNYARELRDTQFHANALAIAKQLLGKDTEPFFEQPVIGVVEPRNHFVEVAIRNAGCHWRYPPHWCATGCGPC